MNLLRIGTFCPAVKTVSSRHYPASQGQTVKSAFTGLALMLTVVLSLSIFFTEANAQQDDYPILTTVKLKEMLDEGKGGFFLIDTRSVPEFEEAHIKGAINIPEKSFKENAEKILTDKEALLIMYCSGIKCGKSKRTAKVANEMGYNNIMIYDDGFPVWEEKGYDFVPGPSYEEKIATTMISPAELKKLIDSGAQDLLIIDARDESEYKEGHIPTAINIPAATIASKQDVLPKDKTLVIYCNAGSRSYMAYRRLMRMEYKNLRQALFADWKAADMPVEK